MLSKNDCDLDHRYQNEQLTDTVLLEDSLMMSVPSHNENNMWASGACWLILKTLILKPPNMWDMSQTQASVEERALFGHWAWKAHFPWHSVYVS